MAVTNQLYDQTAFLFASYAVNLSALKAKLLNASAAYTHGHVTVDQVDNGSHATVTISIASPGVVTDTAHGLSAGAPVVFLTSGALPTGLTAGTWYYVLSTTTNTYQLAATPGGAAINTSGSQSGTHTRYASGSYEVYGNAWPVGGPTLSSVAVAQFNSGDGNNDAAQLTASNVDVVASGGSIGPAYAAVLYDSSTMKVLAFISFGQAQSAGDTTDFKIVWNTAGIINWTYPAG